MKKRPFLFRGLSLLLLVCLLLAGCAPVPPAPTAEPTELTTQSTTAPPEAETTLRQEKTVLYTRDTQTLIDLGFSGEWEGVPFISLSTAATLLTEYLQQERDSSFSLGLSREGSALTLTRENGAQCILDFTKNTILFPDYNRFHMFSYELGGLDILESSGFDPQGQPAYFQRVLSSEKPGQASLLELDAYGIPMYMEGTEGYLTLQTFSDLFLVPYEIMLCYNREAVFLLDGELLGALEKTYYEETALAPGAALIELRYRQLCLLLDHHYGLQKTHNISTSDDYITQLGIKSMLCSEDPAAYFSGLKTLVYKYLSDNHSGVLLHAPHDPEPDYGISAQEASVGHWEFVKNYQLYTGLRKAQFPEQKRPYQEIGDTAFVTFDAFSGVTADYYANAPMDGAYQDEIGLICYAHGQITRPGSPIKNVVIDLATNTGGHMDGGIYLVAWVLGNAVMHIKDPVRNAEGTYLYRADVNLDRVFDSSDTISDKNVYLLTSPVTFSCANYVASALQESGKVTILGATSGGGGCGVYMASLADGAAISFSGSLQFSAYKNGSYYSIDQGIVPDVKLPDLGVLFQYEKLAALLRQWN